MLALQNQAAFLQTFSNAFSLSAQSLLNSQTPHQEQGFRQFVKEIVTGKRQPLTKDPAKLKDLFYCFQCEQTKDAKACGGCSGMTVGVCGKTADLAVLQDLTNYWSRKMSTHLVKTNNYSAQAVDLIIESIYATLTNVNFDEKRFVEYIQKMKVICGEKGKNQSLDDLINEASTKKVAIQARKQDLAAELKIPVDKAEEIIFCQELLMYGIKGFVAYYYEAIHNFNAEKKNLPNLRDQVLEKYLVNVLSDLEKASKITDINALVGKCLECGEMNYKAMEILDRSHNLHFGCPEISELTVFPPKNGKAVCFSGHNYADLKAFLEATKDEKDLFVYTHGEMLPSHMFPELKKYKHLAGHWGSAWQNQKKEFDIFPGPIVMTTNCVMPPKSTYANRLFTTDAVGVTGSVRLDFLKKPKESAKIVLESARKNAGFNLKDNKDRGALAKQLHWTLKEENNYEKKILTGFRHEVVLSKEVSDLVITAVKEGYIKHFFLIGGCDGSEKDRSYFTEVAKHAPKDTVILTLGCGKYRVNDLDLGVIKTPKGDIPRILDCGQCNDSFSAVQIAVALSKVFNCSVNDLPLTLVISWFEQKAVAVFLTLLKLGVKNIRLGPRLPAFIPAPVLNVLVKDFGVTPVGLDGMKNVDIDADIRKMMKKE